MTATDRMLRIATIAIVVTLAAIGLALPGSILVGGVAWLAFLFAMFAGWGYLAIRATKGEDLDFALRAAWGIAAFLAVAGLLVAIGKCTRGVLLGLSAIGTIGFAWRELVTVDPAWHAVRRAGHLAKENPALAALVGVIVLAALGQMIGGVAMLDRNAWDDDICYTPLAKRLLDRGDIVEPFAFRRMSAYGGQTVLHALAGARGTLANINLVDKGLAHGLALLLIVGHARDRRTHGMWMLIAVMILLFSPHIMLNTASYFTGLMMFLALYRSVTRERWIMVGLVAAATCTFRQNYLPVVTLFVLFALGFRLRTAARASNLRDAWRSGKRAWFAVIVPAAIAILPWLVASLLSNRTFLFPFVPGTYNTAITLVPETSTWSDELGLAVWSSSGPAPIIVVPMLFVALAYVKDDRISRPLIAMWLATLVGFAILVHGFLSSDPTNLWRYAFGYAAALSGIMAVELAGLEDGGEVRLPQVGRYLVLGALVMQLVVTRDSIPNQYLYNLRDIREAAAMGTHGDPTWHAETKRYGAMQAAIPDGARVILMVDDPWYLDYTKTDFANLDSPGFSSAKAPNGEKLPSFTSAAAWHRYFKSLDYSYAAFVRPAKSRYFFRKGDWLHRIFADTEIFEMMSAYTLDAVETFDALSKQVPILYEGDGLVVLDLRGDPGPVEPYASDEATRRYAWVRALAEREGRHDAWTLSDRELVRFHDGFNLAVYTDKHDEVVPRGKDTTGTASRGMHRRTHVRVKGTGRDIRLVVKGKVAIERVMAQPRLDVSIDGNLLGTALVDPTGAYALEVIVPAALASGTKWHDVYMLWSAMGAAEKDLHQIYTARLQVFEWEPLP